VFFYLLGERLGESDVWKFLNQKNANKNRRIEQCQEEMEQDLQAVEAVLAAVVVWVAAAVVGLE
jgi:hypothetical protein